MSIAEQIKGIRELVMRAVPNDDSRVITFRGVTETVASDGGILRAKGLDRSRYMKNPVVKWNHSDEIIGRTVKLTMSDDKKAWDFDVEFMGPELSEFADQKYRWAKAGFLLGASAGFMVTEFEELSDKKRQELGLPRNGWVGKRWKLHELSMVPVGADEDALKRSIESGYISEEEVAGVRGMIKRVNESVLLGNFIAIQSMRDDGGDLEEREEPTEEAEPMKHRTYTIDLSDHALRAALDENTREVQHLRGAFADLADELAGLTKFLRFEQEQGEQGAEIEEAQRADSSDADASEDQSELLRQIDELRKRVANVKGDRNEQGNHRGD